MKLDLVLEDANVLTMDPERPRARRVGLWNGRVVGLDEELDGFTSTETLGLDGATITPGFIDAHTHLQLTGQGMLAVDLSPARTPDEALAIIASAAADRPEGAWIEVSGYDQRVLGRNLTAAELDTVVGRRKAWLRHVSSHSSVVSTAVLDGYHDQGVRQNPDVAAGLLEEQLQDVVMHQRLPYSLDDAGRTVRIAAEAAAAQGVTFCMDAGAGGRLGSLNPLDVGTYLKLGDVEPLPVRMQLFPSSDALRDHPATRSEGFGRALDLGVRTGFGDDMLRVGAMKVILDGGMMVRTAKLTEPYAGSEGTGTFREDPEAMIGDIVDAQAAGWQLAVHAIGDAAIDLALDAFEAADKLTPRPTDYRGRHRIEHLGLVRDDQIARITAAGISALSQPSFLFDSGDDFAAQMGPRRTPWLYRGRSFLEAGIPLVASTDRPLPGSPLQAVQTLVDRRSRSGQVIGDGEQITVAQALHTVTTAGAWIAGMEDRLGRIRSGFLADLTVLDDDPTRVPTEEIAGIGVRGTVVDGRVRWT